MPDVRELSDRLGPLGYAQAHGSRPDSPGVYRDVPRGDEAVPDEVWDKSIFTNDDVQAIVHIRRADSPWGRYTVWFRDWVRAHPQERERYEDLKVRLSEANAGKPDYDDYTRAKTVFFDEVQDAFTAWARKSHPVSSRRSPGARHHRPQRSDGGTPSARRA
ncbi:GrpB family protein [Microbacterium sp. Bi121]|uniref:GrpB family protein n=1 Tax=Microbacterium sp. Bi121 TaxID=2822348 RepID=UPI001E03F2B3|nr:GrpB family protein [Microbacterium sp. Bi121]CAH0178311.1 hypothetical protein SRABI121_01929 [Microbacterium sp. Bi121]